jgi:hypothetical protein
MTGEAIMTNTYRIGLAIFALSAACASAAADFDGSKMIICAPVEAMDCTPGAVCARGLPEEVGAPAFLRIDFGKKLVVGPKRSTAIVSFEKNESQVLLQGTELGFGWSIAVDQQDGRMSATLTNREGAFVLFGSCTPL